MKWFVYFNLLRTRHTNASAGAITHATWDAPTDATIAWLSSHQRDDRRDVQRNMNIIMSPHVRRAARWPARRKCNILKKIALPIIVHVVALVYCPNDEIVCLKNRRDVARDVARAIALVCFTLLPPSYLFGIFTHLKLCLANAIHNFKWVKFIQIWQNGGHLFFIRADWYHVLSLTCLKAGIYRSNKKRKKRI